MIYSACASDFRGYSLPAYKPVAVAGIIPRESFHTTTLTTAADSLTVIACGVGGVSSSIAYEIDGVLSGGWDVPGDGIRRAFTLTLDGGSHTVRLWDSCHIGTGASVVYAGVTEIVGDFEVVAVPPTRRLVGYGDSLSQGYYAGFVIPGGIAGFQGWWQLAKIDPSFGDIRWIGSAGRELRTDEPNQLALWLVDLLGTEPTYKDIWLDIGTNDYAHAIHSPAAFRAMYQALLAELQALGMVSSHVFAQTPIVATVETANGLGFTLPDYRNAIHNAVGTVGFGTIVDGASALTLEDLQDGIHPTPAGHVKKHAWFRGIVG